MLELFNKHKAFMLSLPSLILSILIGCISLILGGDWVITFFITEFVYLSFLAITLGCKVWDNIDYLKGLYDQVKNQEQDVIGLNEPNENDEYGY